MALLAPTGQPVFGNGRRVRGEDDFGLKLVAHREQFVGILRFQFETAPEVGFGDRFGEADTADIECGRVAVLMRSLTARRARGFAVQVTEHDGRGRRGARG